MRSPTAPGPLDGIRVLDLSSVLMGPSATRQLGDLGAEVILVEQGEGDRNRTMGPGPHPELSGIALNLLRNKRGVVLDLKQDRGRQVFLDLAATCDVLITNLRPGPLARLGLDYEAVRAVRDDIIFCTAHGFPSDSDNADAPAYDDIIQAASGIADLFHRKEEAPSLAPTVLADKFCGMTIANAVLAALLHRANTGRGQEIEIPMIDVMRAFVLTEHGAGGISEPPVAEPGYPRILTPARAPARTADGWLSILPYDENHFVAIYRSVGRDDLIDRELIKGRRSLTTSSDRLYRDVASVLPERTSAEWLEFCADHGIPATEVASLDELLAELPIEEHPVVGAYRIIPPPERFSETPPSIRRPAPRIGEHGREVLAEIGYDPGTLDILEADGILGTVSD